MLVTWGPTLIPFLSRWNNVEDLNKNSKPRPLQVISIAITHYQTQPRSRQMLLLRCPRIPARRYPPIGPSPFSSRNEDNPFELLLPSPPPSRHVVFTTPQLSFILLCSFYFRKLVLLWFFLARVTLIVLDPHHLPSLPNIYLHPLFWPTLAPSWTRSILPVLCLIYSSSTTTHHRPRISSIVPEIHARRSFERETVFLRSNQKHRVADVLRFDFALKYLYTYTTSYIIIDTSTCFYKSSSSRRISVD